MSVAPRSLNWIEARVRAEHTVEVELRGQSMAPSLRPGDVLEVVALDGAPRAGDIVVARRGARLVTHRVRGASAATVVTRGDGCRRDDPPIGAEAIVGRVRAVRRGARVLAPPGRPPAWRRAISWIRGSR